jgi:hypothetical protein
MAVKKGVAFDIESGICVLKVSYISFRIENLPIN